MVNYDYNLLGVGVPGSQYGGFGAANYMELWYFKIGYFALFCTRLIFINDYGPGFKLF